MNSDSRIALAYGFLGSNLGDVAITTGALALLREAGAQGTIKVISRGLNTRLTRGSWERVLNYDSDIVAHAWDHTLGCFRSSEAPTEAFVRALIDTPEVRRQILESAGLNDVERVYYSGGENLYSYGGARDDWNLLGRLVPILAARAEGLRTGFLPCTFGPFDSEMSRSLITEAVSGADFVMARDARSRDQLPAPVEATPGADCAFFTPSAMDSQSPPSRWGKRIAMVPRLEGTGLRLGPEASRAYLDTVEISDSSAFKLYYSIGRRLLASGRFIRLLTQCDADVKLNQALFKALEPHAESDNQLKLTRPANLKAYHRILATCGSVVTSRLHTAIFALQNGVVPLALYYETHGHKTPGVLSLLDIERFCLPAESFTADMLLPLLSEARRSGEEAAASLQALRAGTVETVRAGGFG